MSLNHAEAISLLKDGISPDQGVLFDDGEFCIKEETATSGLLIRICDMALLEEDDTECYGGYEQNLDGAWVVHYCTENDPLKDTIETTSAEFTNKDSAVAALWILRHQTFSYRVRNNK